MYTVTRDTELKKNCKSRTYAFHSDTNIELTSLFHQFFSVIYFAKNVGVPMKFLQLSCTVYKEIAAGHCFICAGIFKQSIGARNRVEIELSYRPARLHSLPECVKWN